MPQKGASPAQVRQLDTGLAHYAALLQQITEFNRNASPYIMLVGFRYENPTGSTLIQEGLQRMFAGDATAEEVAEAEAVARRLGAALRYRRSRRRIAARAP